MLPKVNKRTSYTLRLGLFDENGKGISESTIDLDVFPKQMDKPLMLFASSSEKGVATGLLNELKVSSTKNFTSANTIIIDNFEWYQKNKNEIDALVKNGKSVLFLELKKGEYAIGNSKVTVENTAMGSYYFASPTTGHSIVKDNKPMDFKFWYHEEKGLVAPFLNTVFIANDWIPIISSGSTNWVGDKGNALAVAEINHEKGKFRVCQLQLNNRLSTNPTARIFVERLLK